MRRADAHDPAITADAFQAQNARRLERCRAIIGYRRALVRTLGNVVADNPFLDMVLDLYVAEFEGREVCQSGMRSQASRASAHRHVATLVDEGIIVRDADPRDMRRNIVMLARPVRRALDRFMDELPGLEARR